MNDLQPKRIGFYPVSARDYLEPLRILKTHVDQLIFCDIACVPSSPRGLIDIREVIAAEDLPQASFLLGDVLSALE